MADYWKFWSQHMFQVEAQTTKAQTEATWCEFCAQLKEVKAWAECRRGTGTGVGAVKSSKFDGTTSWAVFRHHFETVADHNCRPHLEKSTYLITPCRAMPRMCYMESQKVWPMGPGELLWGPAPDRCISQLKMRYTGSSTPGPARTLSGSWLGQAALRREQRDQLESNHHENKATLQWPLLGSGL
jgi:hypothetical protein